MSTPARSAAASRASAAMYVCAMPVGQAVTATIERRPAGALVATAAPWPSGAVPFPVPVPSCWVGTAEGLAEVASVGVVPWVGCGVPLAGLGWLGAGRATTSVTRSTTSWGESASRSPSVKPFLTRARASWVSTLRWVASPSAGAAMRKARSAGPSLAPKSVGGESRANARVGTSTAAVRQCGIAMPPGRPVADVASRARASRASWAASWVRPASATWAASAWITSALSLPSDTSSRTSRAVIISSVPAVSVIVPSVLCVTGSADGTGCWFVERAHLHQVGPEVGRCGDRGAGKGGGRAAVGDGEPEPVLGGRVPEIPQHVPEQAGVTRSDRADHGGRGRGGMPRALLGDEHGTRAAQRREDGADAAVDEQPRRLGRGERIALDGVGVAAGERGELLAVRLHQRGRVLLERSGERDQRGAGGVHRHAGAAAAQGADQLGVPAVGGARRQRAGQDHPPGLRCPVGHGGAQPVQVGSPDHGAGGVDLGRGAVRLGEREVDAHRPGRRLRPAVDAVAQQVEDERVVLLGGQHGDRPHVSGDRGPGDVHPLAAALGGHGLGPEDGTADEVTAQGHGPVDTRVGGQRDDHATTTSTPWRSRAARSDRAMPLSVTTTSTSPISANRTVCSCPILEESISTTTRCPLATIARFAAASAWSGVVSPCPRERPLAPTKATSTRRRANDSTVSSPTAACVVRRTRLGSRCRSTLADPASRAAIGTALVTTVRLLSRGNSMARRAVVVPASSTTLPPVGGSSATAARAMRSFSSAWARSRSPTFGSSAVRAEAGTA